MAKLMKLNDYNVIACTRRECIASELLVSSEEEGVCGRCNLCGDEPFLDDVVYYIPLLDVVYCDRCMKLFCMSERKYNIGDKKVEEQNLKIFKDKMVDMDCWEDDE